MMPWNRRRAAHLFRRAGFAGNTEQLDAAVGSDPHTIVSQWLDDVSSSGAFNIQMQRLADSVLASGNSQRLAAWWLYRMLHTPNQLVEKMTLFWHGHFATSADKVEEAALMHAQNEMLRGHALGDFGEMVHAISRDPAMLVYLDSDTNRKAHPNENYARELMELFCLGEGRYTETDIRELARCFTGWEIRRGKFRFNRHQHDDGEKTIFDRRGGFGGDEAVDLVLDQPAAPQFICRKLVRYFVMDELEPDAELLAALTTQFRSEGLRIAPLVSRVLTSRLFFSADALAAKIRSPVELAIGFLRALKATTDTISLTSAIAAAGQSVFYPANVKGWDGGRAWINSSTLLARSNLIAGILESENTKYAGGPLEQLVERNDATSPDRLVDWLTDLLLAAPLPAAAREQLVDLARECQADPGRQAANVVGAMSILPEFQLA